MAATILASTWTANQAGEDPPSREDNGSALSVDGPDASQLRQWFSPIAGVNADITLDSSESVPPDGSQHLFSSAFDGPSAAARKGAGMDVAWEPTNFCSRPLYFEDVQLERYGQTIAPRLQPIFSSAKFLGSFPLLPIKMVVDPPHHCVYTLGYYRPGTWYARPCPHCQRVHARPSSLEKERIAPPVGDDDVVDSQ